MHYPLWPHSVNVDSNSYEFQFYSGGLYMDKSCSSSKLNHAMLLVGYGTSNEGQDYWILKNRSVNIRNRCMRFVLLLLIASVFIGFSYATVCYWVLHVYKTYPSFSLSPHAVGVSIGVRMGTWGLQETLTTCVEWPLHHAILMPGFSRSVPLSSWNI